MLHKENKIYVTKTKEIYVTCAKVEKKWYKYRPDSSNIVLKEMKERKEFKKLKKIKKIKEIKTIVAEDGVKGAIEGVNGDKDNSGRAWSERR